MAVFTHISEKELERLLSCYNLGALERFEGIEEGVENTNYHVFTDKDRFILTLFERRIEAASLPYCFGLMNHMRAKGIACPNVLRDSQNYQTRILASRPAAMLTFLEGRSIKSSDIKPHHCAAIGTLLANMHKASSGYVAMRSNPVGLPTWEKLFCKVQSYADEVAPDLSYDIVDTLMDIREKHPFPLPAGAIHADLFPDNVFFDDAGQNVTGVIDFYFACHDSYLYDLCLTLNAWCGDDETYSFDAEKAKAFIDAYQSIRPLSSLERKYFPLLRRAAALRILMTRLHDWFLGPEDQDEANFEMQKEGGMAHEGGMPNVVLVPKDPEEYAVKLRWKIPDDLLMKL
jgi:homoserine kinase type II